MSRETEVRDALDWLGRRTKTLVDKARHVVDAGGLLHPLTDSLRDRLPRWQARRDGYWQMLESLELLDGAQWPTLDFLVQLLGEGLAALFVTPPTEVRRWTARLSKYPTPSAQGGCHLLQHSGANRLPSGFNRSALAATVLPICWAHPGLAEQLDCLEQALAGLRRESGLARFFHPTSRSPDQLSGVTRYLMEAFTLVLMGVTGELGKRPLEDSSGHDASDVAAVLAALEEGLRFVLTVAEANRQDLPLSSGEDEVMPLTEVLALLDAWLAAREYGDAALDVSVSPHADPCGPAAREMRETLGDLAFECLTEPTFECAEEDAAWLETLIDATGQPETGPVATCLDELLQRSPAQWVHLLRYGAGEASTCQEMGTLGWLEVTQREGDFLPQEVFQATLNSLGLAWVGILADASAKSDWLRLWSDLDIKTQTDRLDEWVFALFMIAVFGSGESA